MATVQLNGVTYDLDNSEDRKALKKAEKEAAKKKGGSVTNVNTGNVSGNVVQAGDLGSVHFD